MLRMAVATWLMLAAGFVCAETYGEAMPPEMAKPLGEVISSLEAGDTVTGKFTGTISQVCQKKGCFMVLADGAQIARVTFKDYGFFVPKDAARLHSVVYGALTTTVRSAAEANHFAEDAGLSARVSSPVKEYAIVASSVHIAGSGSSRPH